MSETLRSLSPSDPSDELGRFPMADGAAVDAAVGRAREAFPGWRGVGLETRAEVARRFARIADERREEMARLIAREVGKALWDARAEARLLAAKVEATLAEGLAPVREMRAGTAARASFHPRGVLAVLGPFNFPAHLPNGHVVPALVTGNTAVLKPSELAPAVGELYARWWRDAGLPEGALEVVQGGADTGRLLAAHPACDGVLFTGSWAAGRAIQEASLDQPWKVLALEMGGKNAVVVLEDADLDTAVAETALSVAASTGQRCSCASRLFVHERVADAFTRRLCRVLQGLRAGDPLCEDTFMGPLVSAAAREKLERYRARAGEAGGERILDVDPGVEGPGPWVGAGLVRFDSTRQSHPYQRDELFGPEAALYPVRDLDHAVAAVNDCDYGLVASVMTASRDRYDWCRGRVRTGLLNWNRATVGASGRLPFGGLRRSGNDRPAGITATVYCTFPQAHLERDPAEEPFDPDALPPGMPAPR